MTRNIYNEQLEALNQEIRLMGELCKSAITYAVTSIVKPGEQVHEKVTEIENEINQKERTIEQLCMKLILRQQPVASDLRLISSALKLISDMERIGDQAYDISQIMPENLDNVPELKQQVIDMAKQVVLMVSDASEAFVSRDIDLAHSVIEADDKVDGYFIQIKQDLIEAIAFNKHQGELYLDILMIAKYLERIGDHSTNIAEWVDYALTAHHKNIIIKE